MYIKQELTPGIEVSSSLYYSPAPVNASQTTNVVHAVGIVVTGSQHSGKTVNLVGSGSFIYSKTFTIPAINDTLKHYYLVTADSAGQIVPSNQTYTQTVVATQGTNTITVENSELIYISTSSVAPVTNLTAKTIDNTNGQSMLLSWVNGNTYDTIQVIHWVYDDGYANGYTTFEKVYSIPGRSTSLVINTGVSTAYHFFQVIGKTSVPSVFSPVAFVQYRSPMMSPINVESRILRTGILLSWTDPNPENTGRVLKYRISVTAPGYSSNFVMESDQRQYYFANLPRAKSFTFTVAVIDSTTGVTSPYSTPTTPLFLPFVDHNGKEPYDYRLGTSLVNALYIGETKIWTRS